MDMERRWAEMKLCDVSGWQLRGKDRGERRNRFERVVEVQRKGKDLRSMVWRMVVDVR